MKIAEKLNPRKTHEVLGSQLKYLRLMLKVTRWFMAMKRWGRGGGIWDDERERSTLSYKGGLGCSAALLHISHIYGDLIMSFVVQLLLKSQFFRAFQIKWGPFLYVGASSWIYWSKFFGNNSFPGTYRRNAVLVVNLVVKIILEKQFCRTFWIKCRLFLICGDLVVNLVVQLILK